MDNRTGHTGMIFRTIVVLATLLHLARNVNGQVKSDLCPETCADQTCNDPYTNDLDCTSGCVDGYWGNKCYNKCPINCKTCHRQFNANVYNRECYICKDGFYRTNTKKECTCNDQCSGCNTGCNGCSPGYYLHDTTCRQCPAGCSECTFSGFSTTCTACNSGYTLYYSACIRCNTVCSTCLSGGACTACISGYFLEGTNCQQCPSSCSTCNSNNECTTCIIGYYLDKSQCQQCPSRCSKCFSETLCTKCSDSYLYFDPRDMCQTCVAGRYGQLCYGLCPGQCQTCTSNYECQTCEPGYYNSDTVSNCLLTSAPCPSNCDTCQSETECETCMKGYYMTATEKDCSNACPAECATCDSGTSCTSCKPNRRGYLCQDCVDGKYGDTCELDCPQQCKTCTSMSDCTACANGHYNTFSTSDCSPTCLPGCKTCTTGDTCTACKTNFQGHACDSCVDGFWGSSCGYRCPANCMDSQCKRGIGFCIACQVGYTGDRCDRCVDGLHGENCDKNCSTYCKNTKCARNGGFCDDGCISSHTNFNSHLCVFCKNGYHGVDCTQLCPANCLDSACLQESGNCFSCVEGFAGDRCDQCSGDKYGIDCNLDCSPFCSNGVCDRDDGTCSPCTTGNYGNTCQQPCSQYCNGSTCDQTNGFCSNGCKTGYSGDKCCVNNAFCEICSSNHVCQVCVKGQYGRICDNPCNGNCDARGCNKGDGTCFGCKFHYYGDKCQNNCSANCAESDGTSRCHHQSGFCTGDCVTGFYGDVCNMTCGGNCNDNACDKAGTACLQSCKPGFTGDLCSGEEKKKDPSLAPVIGGAAGGAVVLAIIVVVIAVLMRRRKNKNKGEDFPSRPATKPKPAVSTKPSTLRPLVSKDVKAERRPNISEPDSPTDGDESDEEEKVEPVADVIADISGDMYGNIGNIRKRIAVVELEQYVATTPRQDFITEYKVFPRGLIKPHDDSRMPENMGKNRYAQVYPYDENRVKLTGRSTDYVNASYINGHNKERAYIASLGPTLAAMEKHSLFWDMVWQKDVEKIVMVTNLVEHMNMKVQQYWPEANGTMTYGNITVMNLHENVSTEYTVRNFSVSKGNQKRTVSQVHFTAWPDKGVPDHVTSIVEFHNRVKSLKHELNGPILVHCSAGIGRTGTYIALDILTEEGEATGHVDIYNCVRALRQQRVNMVQTESQYIYLHKAVAHNLTYDSRPIPSAEFQKVTADTSDTEFQNKFERLKRTMEEMTEEEDKSKRKSKTLTELNRNGTDIPAQRHRPLLYKYQSHGDNDYVNAVFINSFKTKNHFIAAQTPLPATVVDFIKLILQENCPCVVNLEPETLKTKSLGEYLPPDNQTVTHGQFQLSSTKLISPDAYTVRQVTIVEKDKKKAKEAVVHCFQFNAWPGRDNVPRDPATFLRFIKNVTDKAKEMTEDGDYPRPILIHCLSGAIKCGLFCAVHNAVEKMENEQEVSIENIMRQIKIRRRSALSNKDQLAFCYKSVCAYLDLYNTYSNFELRL